MSRPALIAGLLLGLAAVGSAAEPVRASAGDAIDERFERIEVRVTAIGAASIFLDAGRDAGLADGDRVELFPSTGPMVRGVVRSLSSSSSRIELLDPAGGLVVGDRGEALVPRERLEPAPAEVPEATGPDAEAAPIQEPRQPADLPEHPPWELDLDGVAADAPLLAPIEAVTPDERPMDWYGRLWFDLGSTEDREGTESSNESLRTGFDVTFENAFGIGGSLELDAEVYERLLSVEGEPDETDGTLRLDRLSYLWGGDRERPTSWQVGRFHSRGMPEFGRLDGVEYRRRLADGSSWGAHLGLLPEPGGKGSTGDDQTIGLFHRWVDGPDETLTVQSGLQKTWHEGHADRDLLVVTSTWRPAPRAFLYASAWLDLYGSDDTAKGSGLELTQLFASGTWRTEAGHGWGVTLSHFRIPELLRSEFDPVTAEQLADDRTTRLGLRGWRKLGDGLRLEARGDRWEDQDDSGGRLNLELSARDRLYEGGEVRVGVFHNDNKYSSGPGLRLSASKDTPGGWLRLSFESFETTNDDFFGEQETLGTSLLRASWDLGLPGDWDLSLSLEERFGDAEDATTLGLFVQKRFR